MKTIAALNRRYRRIGFGVILVAMLLLGVVLATPVSRFGDGSEYFLMAQSLLFDRDLIVDNQDIARDAQLKPFGLDTPAGVVVMDRTGVRRYGLHSFYYPAVVTPFYYVFSYHGFRLANAAALFLTFLMLLSYVRDHNSPRKSLMIVLLSLGFTPLVGYISWPMAELFYLFLLTATLYLVHREKYGLAGVPYGIAVGAVPLLGVIPALYCLSEIWRTKRVLPFAWMALVAIVFTIPQTLYNFLYLGTWNPVARDWASFSYLDWHSAIGTFLDPAYGLLWFYPMVLFVVLSVKWGHRELSLVIGVALFLVLSGVQKSLFSHQVGLRYLVYAVPNLIFALRNVDFRLSRTHITMAFTVLVGAGLLTNSYGNSINYANRSLAVFPFTLLRDDERYPYHPGVFMGMGTRLNTVIAAPIHRDRWTQGGRSTRLLITSKQPFTSANLLVRSWNEDRLQHVQVRAGENSFEWDLAPRRMHVLPITFTEGQVKRESREGYFFAYVFINASGSVDPSVADVNQGSKLRQVTRSVGVQFLGVELPTGIEFFEDSITGGSVTGPRATARALYRDGWTVGDFPAYFTIRTSNVTLLRIDVGPGNTDESRELTVTTRSGSRQFVLEPNKLNTIEVPLEPGDIVNGTLALTIKGRSWLPPPRPGAGDPRTLGVRVTQITQGDEVLFSVK
jgi:hypothetical protein